jgi:aerobic C4-dicarboxylate transport protein
VLIGTWTKTVDVDRVREVLDRKVPFDERTMVDDDHGTPEATLTQEAEAVDLVKA